VQVLERLHLQDARQGFCGVRKLGFDSQGVRRDLVPFENFALDPIFCVIQGVSLDPVDVGLGLVRRLTLTPVVVLQAVQKRVLHRGGACALLLSFQEVYRSLHVLALSDGLALKVHLLLHVQVH